MTETESISNLDEPSKDMLANLFSGLTEQVLQGESLDAVLNSIYESFQPVLPFNRIGCALLDETGELVVSRWCRSDSNVMLGKNFSAPLKGSSLQFVLEQKRPRILNNLEEYLQKHPHSESTRLIVNEGIRSSFTFPLTVEGHSVGFLFFSSIEIDAYSEAHLALFNEIAGLLSLAILTASQRDRFARSNSKYLYLLNRLVRSVCPRSEHVVQLVCDLAQILSPEHIKDCETAAILIEARDIISTNDDQEHRAITDLINKICNLETVSTIINHYDKQSDLVPLIKGNIRNESLALAANLIRIVRQYKFLENVHSSNHLPLEHLRREPETFASFIIDELERAIVESVSDTTRRVMIKELVDGMIFKEHVVASDGAILVSSNHIVDKHTRRRLKNFGNYGIRVMEPLVVSCEPNNSNKSKTRGAKIDHERLCTTAR
ncbi:GAF domain-containing protein [Gimesia aquarii]|uniref:GAF domain-containing protein n=1 Tax=Gimesia aquarii TaxID=2527964 RepID=A0A517WTU2_9PLAN|nr:GAF domain-containing protein [Gimesia aquarii]QDU08685.1 hypothetical protein V202x_20550 [Gimesia aquarii]